MLAIGGDGKNFSTVSWAEPYATDNWEVGWTRTHNPGAEFKGDRTELAREFDLCGTQHSILRCGQPFQLSETSLRSLQWTTVT